MSNIIIRTDDTVNCDACGSVKKLVKCTELNKETTEFNTDKVYCNTCLNKFERDEDNYTIME